MLHVTNRDRKHSVDQLPLSTSPVSFVNHSHLTAALQNAGDGNTLSAHLGRRGQLGNSASWGGGIGVDVDDNQLHPTIDTDLRASQQPGPRSLDPGSDWDFAKSKQLQSDHRPDSSSNAPWTHYRALSAPEADAAGSWGHHGEGHKAVQTGFMGTGAAESFDGSWSASYLQSPITPFPSTLVGAVDASLLTSDNSLATPTENERYLIGQLSHMQRLDHSPSPSFSKAVQVRSQLDFPASSNQSIQEEEAQDDIEISMEGIDYEDTAETPLGVGPQQTHQPDYANLLGGLGSPVQQQWSHWLDVPVLYASQEPATWLLNDTAVRQNSEGITELFSGFSWSDRFPSQGLEHTETHRNFMPYPTSSDVRGSGLTSTNPCASYQWFANDVSERTLTHAPEQTSAQPHGVSVSTNQPSAGEGHAPSLASSCKSTGSKSIGVSRRARKCSVSDGKKSVALTRVSSGMRRGVRDGQLPPAKALEIAQKREKKTVCIECKSARVTCQYNLPDATSCNKCLKLGSVCTRANFAESTDHQSCNPIFQSCCWHITHDPSRRVTITYSDAINADWLLSQLAVHQDQCNIQITSVTGAVWEIDLRKCNELLSKLPWKGGIRRLALDALVHNRRMSFTAWLDCMRAGKDDTDFDQFIKYTNMPSHNTYGYLSLSAKEPSRQMNADELEDRPFILMAAQLCRIIIRVLEIKGFRDLQKELGDFTRHDHSNTEAAISRTGRLLGTLRWRLALWELECKEFPGAAFSDRVKKITIKLYFWFLFAKRRLPEEVQAKIPMGDWSTYFHVGQVWDDFPQDESLEGFQRWICGSHQAIQNAYKLPPVTSVSTSSLNEKTTPRQHPSLQSSCPGWQLPLGPRKTSYHDLTSDVEYEF